jgi:hypothetical protein
MEGREKEISKDCKNVKEKKKRMKIVAVRLLTKAMGVDERGLIPSRNNEKTVK